MVASRSFAVVCRCVPANCDIRQAKTFILVMLNKSVLNYYSHFSSLFPDFFSLSCSTPQGASFLIKKNHVTLKNNMF